MDDPFLVSDIFGAYFLVKLGTELYFVVFDVVTPIIEFFILVHKK